jgi:hypothetical protein
MDVAGSIPFPLYEINSQPFRTSAVPAYSEIFGHCGLALFANAIPSALTAF